MFGIGLPELIIIIVVALARCRTLQLPELARSMGRALGEFRRMADDVKDTIEHEISKPLDTEDEKKPDRRNSPGTEKYTEVPAEEKPGRSSRGHRSGHRSGPSIMRRRRPQIRSRGRGRVGVTVRGDRGARSDETYLAEEEKRSWNKTRSRWQRY